MNAQTADLRPTFYDGQSLVNADVVAGVKALRRVFLLLLSKGQNLQNLDQHVIFPYFYITGYPGFIRQLSLDYGTVLNGVLVLALCIFQRVSEEQEERRDTRGESTSR